jgi:NAD(P)-dependent dehydrogenase (short-subunit alcohol dehydrogenase family)
MTVALSRLPMRALFATLVLAFGAGPAAATTPPTVLITGASRGIGLELARQYAGRGWNVIATARNPGEAPDLQAIAKAHGNVTLEPLDVTDFASVDRLAARYKGKPIDVLLNNAGISGDNDAQVFGKLRYDVYNEVHAVNVLGPLKMAEAFVENVAASDQKKIINITSTQGSITQTFGGSMFYRSSKSALNMIMRTLSLELKKRGITVGLVSPGFVKTDFTKGLNLPMMITPEQSATAVIKVIDDYGLDKAGTFMRHTGEVAPW